MAAVTVHLEDELEVDAVDRAALKPDVPLDRVRLGKLTPRFVPGDFPAKVKWG